jgi:nucleotide-binding universal stress UspA family protein
MYQKILVPVDGSKLAECVIPHVEYIANGCKSKEVVFARVVEPAYPIETHKKEAEDYLRNLLNRVHFEASASRSEILMGTTAENLIEYAEHNDVDLVIIATHGRSGIGRWVWGSIADRILRAGAVPVFMVRATVSEKVHVIR